MLTRLAAVATPVLSIVVSLARSAAILASRVTPVERRLRAVATPVDSIVVMRFSAAVKSDSVATPVLSIVERRVFKLPEVVKTPV